jgi:hypothetical protein
MKLKTLAEVRKLLGHIPSERRELSTWQHVEATLQACAAGEGHKRTSGDLSPECARSRLTPKRFRTTKTITSFQALRIIGSRRDKRGDRIHRQFSAKPLRYKFDTNKPTVAPDDSTIPLDAIPKEYKGE